MQPNDLNKALDVAIEISSQSGQLIKDSLEIGIKRDWKSDDTPVTAVDKKVNQLVIDTISKEYPDHSILAEEGSLTKENAPYTWVCDPIDGTFPYMHGIPIVTFTLALVNSQGDTLLGLIYDPFTSRRYTATLGQGAYLNGQKLKTNQTLMSLNHTSVGVVYWGDNKSYMTPLVDKLLDKGAKVFAPNSIAYMDALVAAGEFSATIFPGLSAHDSAAASCIVTEAGGVYRSMDDKVERYDRPCNGHIAAANEIVYSHIRRLMN